MSKRIEWVDALKGFLILMVVLGHSIQSVCMQNGTDFMQGYLWCLIYSFHMPAFMAVSGYLAYNAAKPVAEKFGTLMSGILRRFRQLMIPFFIWSVVLFMVNHSVDHVYEYLVYPHYSFWFLWALFFIVCLFNIVRSVSLNLHIKEEFLMILTACILMAIQLLLPDAKVFGYEYVSYYFFYYILAYYLHKHSSLLSQKVWVVAILGIVWFVLGSFYVPQGVPKIATWIRLLPDSMVNIAYRVVTASVFICFMFGAAPNIKIESSWLWKRLLEFGNVSLGIYVVHMVARSWITKGLANAFPAMPTWLLTMMLFIILCIVSLLVVRLLSKCKVTSVWFLGKL